MPLRILVVEDHPHIRRLIRMTFELEQHEVHDAGDGAAALDAARRLQPDLVLLDVMLPGGIDGLEVCRRLKGGDARQGAVPPRVIMVSARNQRSDIEAGLASGADAYLVKPFSPSHLLASVDVARSGSARCASFV